MSEPERDASDFNLFRVVVSLLACPLLGQALLVLRIVEVLLQACALLQELVHVAALLQLLLCQFCLCSLAL